MPNFLNSENVQDLGIHKVKVLTHVHLVSRLFTTGDGPTTGQSRATIESCWRFSLRPFDCIYDTRNISVHLDSPAHVCLGTL
jgi:hypothetical protein